jgi:hypothetical protein
MVNPALGVNAWVTVESLSEGDGTLAALHDASSGVLRCKRKQPCKANAAELGGQAALTTVGEIDSQGLVTRHAITSAVVGDSLLRVELGGPPVKVDAAGDAMKDVLSAFSFPGAELAVSTTKGGTHHDTRLGFDFDVSWSALRLKSITPPVVEPSGTIITTEGGDFGATVLAFMPPTTGASAESWFMGILEQSMRGKFGELVTDTPKRDMSTLSGRPARRLIWESTSSTAEMKIISRGGIFYGVILNWTSRTKDNAAKLQDSFKLIDWAWHAIHV